MVQMSMFFSRLGSQSLVPVEGAREIYSEGKKGLACGNDGYFQTLEEPVPKWTK